jgi:hypothetical protein
VKWHCICGFLRRPTRILLSGAPLQSQVDEEQRDEGDREDQLGRQQSRRGIGRTRRAVKGRPARHFAHGAFRAALRAEASRRPIQQHLAGADPAVRSSRARVFEVPAPVSAVPDSANALASIHVAGVVVFATAIVCAAGAALGSISLLASEIFAVKALLANALPIYAVAAMAAIDVARAGNLLLALVAVKPRVTLAASFRELLFAFVRSRALEGALLLCLRSTTGVWEACTGVCGQIQALGHLQADKLPGHVLVVESPIEHRKVGEADSRVGYRAQTAGAALGRRR